MKIPRSHPNSRISLLTAALLAMAATAQPADPPTLKDAYKDHFQIGVAINRRQFTEQNTNGATLTKVHFHFISPENVMKWDGIHPRPAPDGDILR